MINIVRYRKGKLVWTTKPEGSATELFLNNASEYKQGSNIVMDYYTCHPSDKGGFMIDSIKGENLSYN